MRTAFALLALVVAGAMADGLGGHNHRHNQRQGRAQNGRRQGRNRAVGQARRGGRQEAAPLSSYGAAPTEATEVLPPPDYSIDYSEDVAAADAAPLGSYGSGFGAAGNGLAANDAAGAGGSDPNIAMLEKAVPGVPGEDYPIFAEVPETAFSCEGQVDGGYYADPEAQCQVFHICTADGQGGLAKYSFLCPNGTVFNQNYFICDWWFNFDCSEAEGLYSLNDDIAAEREAIAAAAAGGANNDAGASADAPLGSYGAATSDDLAPPPPAYDDYSDELPEAAASDAPIPVYGGPADSAAAADSGFLPTELPLSSYEGEQREARRFRGNNNNGGRRGRNGRQNNGFRGNNRRPAANNGQRRQGRRFQG